MVENAQSRSLASGVWRKWCLLSPWWQLSLLPSICPVALSICKWHLTREAWESFGRPNMVHWHNKQSGGMNADTIQERKELLPSLFSTWAWCGARAPKPFALVCLDYLCIPHTIVYLFDMFQTFSDFVLILFIFGDINIPMFRLFIVLADCTITTGLDSDPYGLLVVFNPSDAISTSPRLFLLIFT